MSLVVCAAAHVPFRFDILIGPIINVRRSLTHLLTSSLVQVPFGLLEILLMQVRVRCNSYAERLRQYILELDLT